MNGTHLFTQVAFANAPKSFVIGAGRAKGAVSQQL
jgi:hypothetical protein